MLSIIDWHGALVRFCFAAVSNEFRWSIVVAFMTDHTVAFGHLILQSKRTPHIHSVIYEIWCWIIIYLCFFFCFYSVTSHNTPSFQSVDNIIWELFDVCARAIFVFNEVQDCCRKIYDDDQTFRHYYIFICQPKYINIKYSYNMFPSIVLLLKNVWVFRVFDRSIDRAEIYGTLHTGLQ